MTIETTYQGRFPYGLSIPILIIAIAAAGPGLVAPPARADGFRNPFHGSAAIAQGNAFVAYGRWMLVPPSSES